MGADFRWMMCGIDDATCEAVASEFPLVDGLELDDARTRAYALLRDSPASLLPRRVAGDADTRIEAEHARAFSSLFALPQFRTLPLRLGIGGERVLAFLSGETSPVEVLFYALGAAQAERLPGTLGNMLVRRDELSAAIARVDAVIAGIDEAAWNRARSIFSMCSAGAPAWDRDEEIRAAFDALPRAMRGAAERGRHFVAVAFWLG
jgi:hypothetical protein